MKTYESLTEFEKMLIVYIMHQEVKMKGYEKGLHAAYEYITNFIEIEKSVIASCYRIIS